MLRWYFIQCIKPACSCSNKVCCTSKGATAKKNNDVCMYEHSHLKKKKSAHWNWNSGNNRVRCSPDMEGSSSSPAPARE